jgi:predicted enzyme related to lactoylglutathione lyase
MGEVSKYPNGTFNWIDLGTIDVTSAKAFYEGLFGWEVEDLSAGDAGSYTMCRLQGKDVAGIHAHSADEGTDWSCYISVDDVDKSTMRAGELGGTVELEPVEIPGAARLSLIRDPSGASVPLWQAKGHTGAGLVNEVGSWCWSELVTAEAEAAKAFYRELFGWSAEVAQSPIPRATFTLGELLIGGVHEPIGQERAPRWTVSFRVADVDETAARAQELGGGILLPPMDIPIGRLAMISDPSEADFGVTSFAGPFRGVDGS